MFVISKNHIDTDVYNTPEEIEQTKAHKDSEYFKLYDDDDILYYEGYCIPEEQHEDHFEPLNWAEPNSGCTAIKYRNSKTGTMDYL